MRTLGNILWHIPFLGFLNALGTFLLGVLLVITVIGAPIGLGLIQLSRFLLAPFSNSMISVSELNQDQNKLWKSFGFIIRIFYFPIGLFLAIVIIFQIASLFISIIGIPVALVLAKALSTYFNPVNKVCVPKSVADELEHRKVKEQVDQHLGKGGGDGGTRQGISSVENHPSITKNNREMMRTFAHIVFGLAGTVLAGFFIYHERTLYAPRPLLFPLLLFGLGGTLIYTMFRFRCYAYAIMIIIFMGLGRIVLCPDDIIKSQLSGYFVSAAIYAIPIGTAFIISYVLYQRLERLKFGRCILMGIVIGIAYFIRSMASLFLEHASRNGNTGSILWNQTFIGIIMGVGIGLGLEVAEIFFKQKSNESGFPLTCRE